jgi:hypothetical protein
LSGSIVAEIVEEIAAILLLLPLRVSGGEKARKTGGLVRNGGQRCAAVATIKF